MKFEDKDIKSCEFFGNGVLLKIHFEDVLENQDDYGLCALYFSEPELSLMIKNMTSDLVSCIHPENIFDRFMTNQVSMSKQEYQPVALLKADVLKNSKTTKRNRAFVFISKTDLTSVLDKINTNKDQSKKQKEFDSAFRAHIAALHQVQ